MRAKVTLVALVLMVTTGGSGAADWPQYLGPERDSTSPETGLLRSWPENGPEVLWTVSVGIGFGGPVIKDGKVYLLDRDDKVGDNLRCFDLANGNELWNFAYDAPGSVMFPGSRSVPIVDDRHVYSCGPYGDLYCVDINTHQPVWNKNVWTDFDGDSIPRWAVTQNPLIYGDLLIVASQAPQAGVVAYDKLNGAVKWTTPFLGLAGYVSPVLVKVSGQDHLVMATAAAGRRGEIGTGGKVVGIGPLSGKILWEYRNWQCRIPVAPVVDAGEGRMLVTGGYNAGAALIQIGKQADGSYAVKELYKTIEFGSHTLPPILHDGHFYAQYSTNERTDGLACMSMDGQVKWQTRRAPLFDKGSMILADGLLLATDGRKTLYLIAPDPSAFRPLATAELLEAGKNQNWAPLALSDGKLLIRDQQQMKCVAVR